MTNRIKIVLTHTIINKNWGLEAEKCDLGKEKIAFKVEKDKE
jgi:hypothetical protein